MSTASHSEQLRLKVRLASISIHEVADALWAHRALPKIYPRLLFTVHSMIRASVPLMEAALESTLARLPSDPVAAPLVEYLEKHIPEELHHDEWLLEDLEVLGLDRDAVLQSLPSATVAALVGSQYYWIYHVHPIALLGYIAVLEGSPPSVEEIEEVVARTGLPKQAFRTYLKHAHLDPHHRDDLNRTLDNMPLTPEHSALIGVSAFQTIHYMTAAFRELLVSD